MVSNQIVNAEHFMQHPQQREESPLRDLQDSPDNTIINRIVRSAVSYDGQLHKRRVIPTQKLNFVEALTDAAGDPLYADTQEQLAMLGRCFLCR